MKKSRQSLLMLGLASIMLGGEVAFPGVINRQVKKKLSEEDRQLIKEESLKKKGLKEFQYGSTIILALNKKSADRKAKAKGLLV